MKKEHYYKVQFNWPRTSCWSTSAT